MAVNPQKADAILPIIIEASGVPESDRIIRAWAELGQVNPQQQQLQEIMTKIQMIMAKLGIEEKQAEVESKKLDNIKKKEEIKSIKENNILDIISSYDNNQKLDEMINILEDRV